MIININTLIKDPSTRKNSKGFEQIKTICMKGSYYAFGIPFSILKDRKKGTGIKIIFSIKGSLNYFPHLVPLGGNLALTTAYKTVLDVKKTVLKDWKAIGNIIQLKQADLIKQGFLIKVRRKDTQFNHSVTASGNLDLLLKKEDIAPIYTNQEITKKREKVSISSFRETTKEELINKIVNFGGMELPDKVKDKKGLLASIMVSIMSDLEEGKNKITEKQRDTILAKYKKNLPNLFKS